MIEYAYKNGLMKSEEPTVRTDKQVAVVGSGPAGLAVADRLNQRGHLVTVFERDDRPGGLLMYGIPNMKIEKNVIERRIELMKKQGVKFETNYNVNSKSKAQKLLSDYDAVVLCCGARKARNIFKEEQKAKGIYYAVDFLASTTKSLLETNLKDGTFISAKDKDVVIVGGGDTGNDCVGTSIRHGAKSVTQLEMLPEPPEERPESNPWPEYPKSKKTDYGQEEAIAVFGHDPRIYSTTVKDITTDENGEIKSLITVKLEAKKDEQSGRLQFVPVEGSETEIPCQLLLIAAGFLGCEDKTASVFTAKLTNRNVIEADGFQTENPKLFAAGDCKNGQSLVVCAIADGRECAKAVDNYLMGYTNMI